MACFNIHIIHTYNTSVTLSESNNFHEETYISLFIQPKSWHLHKIFPTVLLFASTRPELKQMFSFHSLKSQTRHEGICDVCAALFVAKILE